MAHPLLDQPARGFLVNALTIPPLIYPFQYNPAQLSDTRKLTWGVNTPVTQARGGPGLAAGLATSLAEFRTGFFSGIKSLKTTPAVLGRLFSGAELKKLDKEEPRTVTFKFVVDGRELREGEPARRRNEAGDILGDLAIVRSFTYPQLTNWLDIGGATFGERTAGAPSPWVAMWFNEPPTLTLVLGDLSIEGFVTDLKITETRFNAVLDPTRAEIEISLIEKIDSISFILDALKRVGRSFYYTDYEDAVTAVF